MIISASRRTDIPALYSEWLINRLEAGFCIVRNPFNPQQESLVSLAPQDVDVIVFWTKDPRPLMGHFDYLDQRGYHYYFQYTVTGYPHWLEPGVPRLDKAIEAFCDLAKRLGSARVIWRYDPIFFSQATQMSYHVESFRYIARALEGSTQRVVISLWDAYRKSLRRMRAVENETGPLGEERCGPKEMAEFCASLIDIAGQHGMTISSCAEHQLECYGIDRGKCIDDQLIRQLFDLELDFRKDHGQRPECGCIASKDIGAYDTCILGCQYCYAVGRPDLAWERYRYHDPQAPCLAASFAYR
ncbi:MAG: DUF1848 domain-containing protein [Firmicutes bacterium]|nr:DUF1848 domain-containing protein [Bacillota bacterium]